MPSYGLIVAAAVVVSILIMYSASSSINVAAGFYSVYNAYRNLQEIRLYASYLKDCMLKVHSTAGLANLTIAAEVSSALSGISFQISNNSIVVHTLTQPRAYAIIPINTS